MGLKAVVCDVNETLFPLEAFRPRLAAAGLTQDNSLEVRVLSVGSCLITRSLPLKHVMIMQMNASGMLAIPCNDLPERGSRGTQYLADL